MRKKQPVDLKLTKLNFPPMAIVSILHRMSGVVLFLLLPVFLYLLQGSLQSAASFRDLQAVCSNIWVKLGLWVTLSALAYHIVGGLRHLWMDMGYGGTLKQGRISAYCVFVVSFFVILGLGVALC